MKTTLTKNMRVGAELMIAHPNWTNQQIADEIGIAEVTIRKWKYHELFNEYLDKRLAEEWKSYRIPAQKKMKELADNGDYRAIAYILDSNNYQAPQQIEINQNTIKVTIDND